MNLRPPPLALATADCRHRNVTMLGLVILLLSTPVASWAAADQLQEILQESGKARQDDKAKELKAKEQIDRLKQDQLSNQSQQQLDQTKQQNSDPAVAQKPQAGQIQHQLDQLRNDQQLQRLQTDQQLRRIEQDQDPLRQQQQINDLQRQQQIRSLQEQIQRNQIQQDLETMRQQQNNR